MSVTPKKLCETRDHFMSWLRSYEELSTKVAPLRRINTSIWLQLGDKITVIANQAFELDRSEKIAENFLDNHFRNLQETFFETSKEEREAKRVKVLIEITIYSLTLTRLDSKKVEL